LLDDTLSFHEKAIKKYDDLPVFLLTHAYGCLQALNIAHHQPEAYSGMSLHNPMFGHFDQ